MSQPATGDRAARRALRPALITDDGVRPNAADHVWLVPVFHNLVRTARKFTPPRARIVIRIDDTGDPVCVSVRDTGPEIAADDLPRTSSTAQFASADRSTR